MRWPARWPSWASVFWLLAPAATSRMEKDLRVLSLGRATPQRAPASSEPRAALGQPQAPPALRDRWAASRVLRLASQVPEAARAKALLVLTWAARRQEALKAKRVRAQPPAKAE